MRTKRQLKRCPGTSSCLRIHLLALCAIIVAETNLGFPGHGQSVSQRGCDTVREQPHTIPSSGHRAAGLFPRLSLRLSGGSDSNDEIKQLRKYFEEMKRRRQQQGGPHSRPAYNATAMREMEIKRRIEELRIKRHQRFDQNRGVAQHSRSKSAPSPSLILGGHRESGIAQFAGSGGWNLNSTVNNRIWETRPQFQTANNKTTNFLNWSSLSSASIKTSASSDFLSHLRGGGSNGGEDDDDVEDGGDDEKHDLSEHESEMHESEMHVENGDVVSLQPRSHDSDTETAAPHGGRSAKENTCDTDDEAMHDDAQVDEYTSSISGAATGELAHSPEGSAAGEARGFGGATRKADKIKISLLKAAQGGDVDAQVKVGLRLLSGPPAKRNAPRALHWLKKAARLGSGRAAFNVASVYASKAGGQLRNETAALRYLRVGAKLKYGPALYHLGARYLNGESVEKSEPLAISLWRRAGGEGDREADYRLGLLFVTRATQKIQALGGMEWGAWIRRGAADDRKPQEREEEEARKKQAEEREAAEKEWREGEDLLRRAASRGHFQAKYALGGLILGRLVEDSKSDDQPNKRGAATEERGGGAREQPQATPSATAAAPAKAAGGECASTKKERVELTKDSSTETKESSTESRQKEGVELIRQAAKAGVVCAQAAMGRLLLEGLQGVRTDVVEAATWVRLAAVGGDGPSQLLYGCMYIDGFMRRVTVPEKDKKGIVKAHVGAVVQECDPQEGFSWVRKAAERGVSDAQYKLGCYLLSGGEGEADAADKGAAVVLRRESTEEALRWIRMAADGGHADAAWALAKRLASASASTTVATKRGRVLRGKEAACMHALQREACAWMYRAAELDVVEAQAELGRALSQGRPGLLLDKPLPLDQDAPGDGQPTTGDGRCDANNSSSSSSGDSDKSAAELGLAWSRRAAERGDVSAQVDVARALLGGGAGIARDVQEAHRWLRTAAEAGNAVAQYELGMLYVHRVLEGEKGESASLQLPDNGRPDEQLNRGLALLRQAGEAGFVVATHELGRCMRDGVSGIVANMSEARFYLHVAATQGLPQAQADYGELLLRDKKGGVRKNEYDQDAFDGLKWLRTAVTNGVDGAMSVLRDAEMRVGQPGSSAGGRAHSGRGGDVGGGGDFLAHLHAEHPLHAGDGRLRIKVVRARNMPVDAGEAVEATPRGGGKEKRKKRSGNAGAASEGSLGSRMGDATPQRQRERQREPAFVALQFQALDLNSSAHMASRFESEGKTRKGGGTADLPFEDDGGLWEEGAGWGGEGGYRWMELWRGKTRRGGVDGIDNVWERPLADANVATRVHGWKQDPEWNQTFTVYLEGARGTWFRRLQLSLFAIRRRPGTASRAADEVGVSTIEPWRIPLGRRRLRWFDLVYEDGSKVMNEGGGVCQVLLELSRSRARPPSSLMETEEQKEFAAVYKWHTADRSHVEMALRRQQAREARLIRRHVISEPFIINTGMGLGGGDDEDFAGGQATVQLPYSIFSKYLQRDNTDDPIVAQHSDTKFLNPLLGDFTATVVKDGWSEADGKGSYIAPGKQKEHDKIYGDFYAWLRKYTKGRLTAADVPPGTISPFLKPHQVRRTIMKLIADKEQAVKAEAEGKAAARQARRLPLSPYDALFQPAGGGSASVGREMTLRNDSGRTQTGAARTATETGRKGTTDSEVGEEVECQGPIDTAHEELVIHRDRGQTHARVQPREISKGAGGQGGGKGRAMSVEGLGGKPRGFVSSSPFLQRLKKMALPTAPV